MGALRWLSMALSGLLVAGPALAGSEPRLPENTPKPTPTDWKFSGQFLLRTELDGRDFDVTTPPLLFTSLRTRLSAEKELLDGMYGLIQLEDSRIFGDSGSAVSNFKNIDLHQGFLEWRKPWQMPFSLQAGRFEMSYGNQRLISAVSRWNWIGRAFDGIRFKYATPDSDFWTLDAFATLVNAGARNVTTATPEAYVLPSPPDTGHGFYGVWSGLNLAREAHLDLYALFEDNRKQSTPGFADTRRLTAGINHQGRYGEIFSSSAELALQKGSVSDKEVTAWLAAARGFAQLGDFQLGAGADLLSGNPVSSSKTANTFATPFGDGHHNYGYMDYFTDIPGHTRGRGLHDYFVRLRWQTEGLPVTAQVDLHHFTGNQPDADGRFVFGQEADLTLNYPYSAQTALTWGLSTFLPGELMRATALFGARANSPGLWSYVRLIQSF